jgi:hypothetical protein
MLHDSVTLTGLEKVKEPRIEHGGNTDVKPLAPKNDTGLTGLSRLLVGELPAAQPEGRSPRALMENRAA